MNWEVEYLLKQPIPVEQPKDGYPSLSIAFRYDDAGLLTSIVQAISMPIESDHGAVIHASERSLTFFFQVLEYRYGLPIEVRSIQAGAVVAQTASIAPTLGLIKAGIDVAIASIVKLPSEHALTGVNRHITVLFYMFNAARYSTDDAEAVRILYVIWEFLHSQELDGYVPPEADELKCARDFVSHGIKLERPAAVTAIEKILGEPIKPFDPLNPLHQKYVAKMRKKGETFLRHQLDGLL